MIVTQHWKRQFDVGAEWCSLSHCGRGLEYRTRFQTHVCYLQIGFHRRAVQGLRSACSVLPGLSACRFCLFLTSRGPTQACTLMHMQKHTCMCRHTWRQAYYSSSLLKLHYTPPRLPDDYPARPIITRVSVSPWKTFTPPQWKARTLWIAQRWWWWWWWPHLLCLIPLLRLPAGCIRPPANVTRTVT